MGRVASPNCNPAQVFFVREECLLVLEQTTSYPKVSLESTAGIENRESFFLEVLRERGQDLEVLSPFFWDL